MQATLAGEDSNFRVRWMCANSNGCCAIKDGNLLEKANDLVKYVKGLVATDSKDVFDAVNKNEGPLLGLSNARSALQGLSAEGAAERGGHQADMDLWRLELVRCPDEEGKSSKTWTFAICKILHLETEVWPELHSEREEGKEGWSCCCTANERAISSRAHKPHDPRRILTGATI